MQGELFKPVTRTERQHMAEEAWLKARGKGTVVCPTGFGCFMYTVKNIAVPIEESSELLSGNIGENLELESRGYMYENPEINSEIKESESLYSVESET